MKKIIFPITLSFLFGMLTTCKKYPEGPNFTLRTAMNRITGIWEITYYEVNGIDSTAAHLSSVYNACYSFKRGQKACGWVGYNEFELILVNQNDTRVCGGWVFTGGKDWISVTLSKNCLPYAYAGNGFWNFGGEILKLTNKELWFVQNPDKQASAPMRLIKLKKKSN